KSDVMISPVVLFEAKGGAFGKHQYAFVNCGAREPHIAVDWLETYAAKFNGRVVTNFDEIRPNLANAPLSYQRLVTGTYDRILIKHFHGQIQADRIDQVIDESKHYSGDHVGHNVNAYEPAIINIDSVLDH